MNYICVALLSVTLAPQPADPPVQHGQNLRGACERRNGASVLYGVEWLISPGLEMIDDAADEVPEFKNFTNDLNKALRSDDAQSRRPHWST